MTHPYQVPEPGTATPEITITVDGAAAWLSIPDEVDELTAVTTIAAALCQTMDISLTPGQKITLIANIAEETGVSLGSTPPAARETPEDGADD